MLDTTDFDFDLLGRQLADVTRGHNTPKEEKLSYVQ